MYWSRSANIAETWLIIIDNLIESQSISLSVNLKNIVLADCFSYNNIIITIKTEIKRKI